MVFVPVVRVLFMMLVVVSLFDVAMQRFFTKNDLKCPIKSSSRKRKVRMGTLISRESVARLRNSC